MRKILIVGDFSTDSPSDVNSFLAQHFHTQLCTSSAKIVKSMLKLYTPDLVLMDIDDFENIELFPLGFISPNSISKIAVSAEWDSKKK